MSSDAFSPITSSRTLSTPQGHRIYTTTREVPAEFTLPTIGALLASTNFIGGFASHYVLDANDTPTRNGKRVTVTHGAVPAGAFTEWESMAYTFPALYPTPGSPFFPGGSRQRQRVVPARVVYEYALSAAAWLADSAIWDFDESHESEDPYVMTGPFEVSSVIQQAAGETFTDDDGSGGQVGDFLNPTFITQDTVNNEVTISAPGSLFYVIGASAPSLDTYVDWVTAKTELMASRTIHKWYAFYMRRTVWVRAQ